MESIKLIYGEQVYACEIHRSNRSNLEIAVHPDETITLTAPYETEIEVLKGKAQKKLKWIAKQIRFFRQFNPRSPHKLFIHGETHLYLGKQYRLKVEECDVESVKLQYGRLIVQTKNRESSNIQLLLNKWYKEKAVQNFQVIFKSAVNRHNYNLTETPVLKIREMKRRWGSYTVSGNLILNIKLIKAPKKCIEYVIVHELCHSKYPNHGESFYSLLTQIMPDWKHKKQELEELLS